MSRSADLPTVFGWVNDLARATPWLHGAVTAWADYGLLAFAALLVAGWWVSRSGGPRDGAAALWAATGTLLAVAVNQPVVHLVSEARPYTTYPGILVLAHRSADASFPSDHAVMAGAVAAGTWLVSRRLGAVAAAAAVLMAFARVYTAAHYPQDVLAGLLLGAVVVLLGWLVVVGPTSALMARLRAGPLAALLVRPESGRTTADRR